ncbi:MAG TPA: DUF1579 family protein [Thermoanaerobaculia bacterium]|nr:DUF1579 family protein [Thermoanaerobaculia bacterium]
MRKSWKIWLGAAALLVTLPLAAQKTAKEAETHQGAPADYEKILKPAAEHEILDRFVGTWKADLKILLYGPPPKESWMKDILEAQWILNDRFIETSFASEYAGGPVKGKVIMGYDGASKEFFRVFLVDWDSRGTFSRGVYIKSKNALVFHGTEHDPISGDKFQKRDVFTFGPDKNKFLYEEYYIFADGSEIKPIEGYYTRVVPETKK